MENKNAFLSYNKKAMQELERVAAGYRDFLSRGKTERECVKLIVAQAEAAGYKNLAELTAAGKPLKAGDKVYAVCMKKAVALFQIGAEGPAKGLNILGAHIDSPRLDIKQNPLFEDSDLAYLDTHYYGGIKKYQWVTLPLALHGTVVKKDGTAVDIVIGEDASDPVFCVTDLLIHLAQEQLEKKGARVVEGEDLNILVGNMPLPGEKKHAVAANVLHLLKEKYDIDEADFISAELEAVPAGAAREAGFDGSMILSYGQDDRSCAYTSLLAMLEAADIRRTACCLLVDKEEIGSVGATGMQSHFFENTVAEVLELCGEYSELKLRRALRDSKMLSSDVSSAYDHAYAAAFEKQNAAYLARGVVFNKFTGARGKSGSNDANAEYLAYIRRVMDDADVHYQTAELGRVDLGGGGTIAYILALYGMEVIDSGVPVLSMHAPWEVTSKADIYEAYKAYKAFLEA